MTIGETGDPQTGSEEDLGSAPSLSLTTVSESSPPESEPVSSVQSPLTPKTNASLKEQMRELLEASTGRLRQAWEGYKEGMTNSQMVDAGLAANSGAAGNSRRTINTLLGEAFPSTPSTANMTRSSINALVRGAVMSPEARAWVEAVIARLETIIADPDAAHIEEEALAVASETIESQVEQTGGVYVYTYPHYRRHPYAPSPHSEVADRTLLKVGMTVKSPSMRIRQQMRGTAAPEDPVVLRAYLATADGPSPAEMEKSFHRLLKSAGHVRERTRWAGTEWFLTNEEFLDAIADELGYPRSEVSGPADEQA